MKGLSKTVTIEGCEFHVRELTAGEIRVWEQKLNARLIAGDLSATDQFLVDEVSLDELSLMLGESLVTLDEIPPSVLEQLKAACKEVNPRFFTLRELLTRPLRTALDLMALAAPSAG